jgi:hypothetical protein
VRQGIESGDAGAGSARYARSTDSYRDHSPQVKAPAGPGTAEARPTWGQSRPGARAGGRGSDLRPPGQPQALNPRPALKHALLLWGDAHLGRDNGFRAEELPDQRRYKTSWRGWCEQGLGGEGIRASMALAGAGRRGGGRAGRAGEGVVAYHHRRRRGGPRATTGRTNRWVSRSGFRRSIPRASFPVRASADRPIRHRGLFAELRFALAHSLGIKGIQVSRSGPPPPPLAGASAPVVDSASFGDLPLMAGASTENKQWR